ncbi:unnamed protein product [Rotaria magnacalcarata]|uniref:SAC domain-containing protein n=1 Tax=Rotaria magnacalcarata TaxID=392030 RepID=A0A819MR10_9BILA|nr:unnamed protein product [Rotaria magnacalcarata]
MKLYKANDSWIVTTEESSLWFNRRSLSVYTKKEPITDQFLASSAWDASFEEHLDTRWIQPIIMGYLSECHFEVDQETNAQLILISRRNCHRAGVRMHCRGIDNDGNVANYVETEQILRTGNNVMSFIMIRGSVPIYWSQPGIRYRPPPKIDRIVIIVFYGGCANL